MSPAAWVVLVPLAGAALGLAAPRRTIPAVALAGAVATAAAGGALVAAVWREGPLRAQVGGWGAPLGIDLYADGLAAAMVLATSVVGVLVSAHAAAGGAAPWPHRTGFWPLWLLCWASLNALFLSTDIFNIYVTVELLGLTAVALVVLGRELPALTAGTRYLLVAFAGSMLYLLGVAVRYAEVGSLDLYAGEVGGSAALGLMTVGMLAKTGLVPLHSWLPPAHAIAPAPVSPILSGLVVKASFYVVVRLWEQALPDAATALGAAALGVLGVAAIVWGSVGALRQRRLKRLVAYSTVAHLGYLFLLFPLARTAGAAEAWSGALYHALAHAPAKAALFLAAATALHAVGTDRIDDLRGAARGLPLTAYAFGAASVSLVGLPPSGGFVAKWQLVEASLTAGAWWWAVAVVAGGVLAALYLLPPLQAFFGPGDAGVDVRVPRRLQLPALALALVAVGLGLRTVEVVELLRIGAPL